VLHNIALSKFLILFYSILYWTVVDIPVYGGTLNIFASYFIDPDFYKHIHTHIYTNTHTYTYTQTHIHTNTHTNAHTYTQTHIQTHTHTHKHVAELTRSSAVAVIADRTEKAH